MYSLKNNFEFMPIALVVVALIAIVGIGGYFLRPGSEEAIAPITPAEEMVAPAVEKIVEPAVEEPVAVLPDPETDVTKNLYQDGAHKATASYIAPGNNNHIVDVSLTLKDDTITAVAVSYSGDDKKESKQFQGRFSGAIETEVIGKKISDLSLARVGGASLTTGAFNKALAEIKTKAQN